MTEEFVKFLLIGMGAAITALSGTVAMMGMYIKKLFEKTLTRHFDLEEKLLKVIGE